VTSCPFFSTPPSLAFFLGKDDPFVVYSAFKILFFFIKKKRPRKAERSLHASPSTHMSLSLDFSLSWFIYYTSVSFSLFYTCESPSLSLFFYMHHPLARTSSKFYILFCFVFSLLDFSLFCFGPSSVYPPFSEAVLHSLLLCFLPARFFFVLLWSVCPPFSEASEDARS